MTFELHSMKLELETIKQIIKIRMMCSLVSIILCGMVILIYIGLLIFWFVSKKFLKRGAGAGGSSSNSNSFEKVKISAINTEAVISQETSTNKFGLGSHIMFFLMLSNLSWAFNSYFVAKNNPNGFIFETDKDETYCSLFGFFHNWFDLSIIACTTMLTYVFRKATLKIRLKQEEERTLFHFAIFYGFLLPLFICIIPFHTDSYGPGVLFCTVDYLRSDPSTYVWMAVMMAFTFGNFIYSFYMMIMVTKVYNEKLKELKGVNLLEYRMLRIYSTAFILFIMVLIISRCLKESSRIYELALGDEPYGLLYVDGVCFCLGGAFNAVFCFFFFRGIFSCGNSKKNGHGLTVANSKPLVVINRSSVSFDNAIEFKDLGNVSVLEGIN